MFKDKEVYLSMVANESYIYLSNSLVYVSIDKNFKEMLLEFGNDYETFYWPEYTKFRTEEVIKIE